MEGQDRRADRGPRDDSAVRIDDLEVIYRARGRVLQAVSGFDLDVRRGEVVALVGPSGCGKTSVIRAVADLQPVASGRIDVEGCSPRVARKRGLMALMTQHPTLLPHRSVTDNLLLPFELTGTPGGKSAVAEALERAELQDFRDVLPHELSGGMQQRLALARCFILDPHVVLLDEPFSALDELRRERFAAEFSAQQRRRRQTSILVTHSIEEAVFCADRVAVVSALPGSVVSVVDVDLPTVRAPELRLDDAFHAICIEVRGILRMGRA